MSSPGPSTRCRPLGSVGVDATAGGSEQGTAGAVGAAGGKERLRSDLTTAMKARDEVTTRTLRMTLTAIGDAEVAGREKRVLSGDEVQAVLAREAKKRRESAGAFADAGREELAVREREELAVLERYLPQQLDDDELGAIVDEVLSREGLTGMPAMGRAMKAVSPAVAGRAEGGRVAAVVRQRLSGG